MKKKILTTVLLLSLIANANAQIYPGDTYMKYATSALSLFENGQQYFIRGYAYEKLGYLKEARKDYKKSMKMGYSDAARALEAVNEKIKAQRKR